MRLRTRLACVVVGAVCAVAALGGAAWSAAGSASALGVAPTVTLTDPANGALITTGQPVFAGSASDGPTDSGTVIIDIYAGTSTGTTPVQVINTQVSDGSYSARALALPDGAYTVTASESDDSGDTGISSPATFQLFNATPQLTLAGPAAPITTPQPTFTGTAETGTGVSTTVQLIIYPGNSTDVTPVAVLNGSVQANGSFAITVQPGLVNGAYTAVASQQLPLTDTFSPAVAFAVDASNAPLTVTSPQAGASEPQTGLVFTGAAGTEIGDAAHVVLTLYRGRHGSGTPVGSATVALTGAHWSEQWPTTLALGTYTVVATQAETGGQSTVTRTFTVLAPGSVTGPITISAAGRVSARLRCLAGAGTCNGDVLIVTKTDMATVYGGPVGPLRLMFAHYSVAAAHSARLTATLSSQQLAALRHAGPTRLVVTVAYPVGQKLTETSHSTAAVSVG